MGNLDQQFGKKPKKNLKVKFMRKKINKYSKQNMKVKLSLNSKKCQCSSIEVNFQNKTL